MIKNASLVSVCGATELVTTLLGSAFQATIVWGKKEHLKCKVLSNHMKFIKLNQVMLFPYIIGRFQNKFCFLNSRIAGRGVHISHSASVSDRTCRTGHFFTWGKND